MFFSGTEEIREVQTEDTKPIEQPPRILNHTVSIMGNMIPSEQQAQYTPLIIDGSRLLEQLQVGFVGFTSVINAAHAVQVVQGNKTDAVPIDVKVDPGRIIPPVPSYQNNGMYTTVTPPSATYTSQDRYNYHTYG